MSFMTWTRHEWRQLRLVRRVSLLLTFAVPFVLLAGAAASQRGWLPGQRIRAWDVPTVLYDATPLVLAAVWGLVAALATGQVLAGGRASGSEWLVLSLPMRRSVVWFARLAAALTTVVVVAVLSLGFVLAIGRVVSGSPNSDGWSTGATAGMIAILLSMLGTAAVAPLLRQPFQAALAGMVVGATPIGVASWVASVFPLAGASANVPVALVAALPLIPAFAVVSFVVSARGEPAGRGRVVRAVWILSVAVIAGSLLFVAVATATVRIGRDLERDWLVPAPAGDRALGMRGIPAMVSLYDTRTREVVARLGLSTFDDAVAWSPDGERFAMIENVTTLGRMRQPILTIRSATNGAVLEEVTLSDDAFDVHRIVWCAEIPVLDSWRMRPSVVDGGRLRPLAGSLDEEKRIEIVGCIDDDILIAIGDSIGDSARRRGARRDDESVPVLETELLRVPLDPGSGKPVPLGTVGFAAWRSYGRLSPDGRFVVAQSREFGAGSIEVLHVPDGTRLVLDGVDLGRWGWLSNGTLIWAEDGDAENPPSIRAWRPGEEPTEFEIDAPVGAFATMELSPDARRVLVRASHREGDAFVTDRIAILDPATGRWTAIPGSETDDGKRWSWGRWASADSIVMESPERRSRLVRLDP